jgi:SAM-dependent methyltransferase
MDFSKAECALRSGYSAAAEQYRKDDEIEVTTGHHRHLSRLLKEITLSFGRPITVLDAGCGTGRYFYCLKNVERLIGMDITPAMLDRAREPVNGDCISARDIQLVVGNVFFASFAPHSFDFIYSLGMFGHGCPMTVDICNRFHSWLTADGELLFDTVDVSGLTWSERLKKHARHCVYHLLPERLQTVMDERQKHIPFFTLTKRELSGIMRTTRFSRFRVSSHVCESPLWEGRHLICRASTSASGS